MIQFRFFRTNRYQLVRPGYFNLNNEGKANRFDGAALLCIDNGFKPSYHWNAFRYEIDRIKALNYRTLLDII